MALPGEQRLFARHGADQPPVVADAIDAEFVAVQVLHHQHGAECLHRFKTAPQIVQPDVVLHACEQQLRAGAFLIKHAETQAIHRHRGLDAQLGMVLAQLAVGRVELRRRLHDAKGRWRRAAIDALVKARLVVQQVQHVRRGDAQHARALRLELRPLGADEAGLLAGNENANALRAAKIQAPGQIGRAGQPAGLDAGHMRSQKSWRMCIRAAADDFIIARCIRLTDQANGRADG